jgi:DNA-binding transcriptional LysR family regulator
MVEDDLTAGRLVVVLPDRPLISAPVHILHPFGRQIPLRVRIFIDFLVNELGGFTNR